MLAQQRSMNDSDFGKKKSVYWNVPSVPPSSEVRDETRVASMLSLTMALSLAKTFGAQSEQILHLTPYIYFLFHLRLVHRQCDVGGDFAEFAG